MRLPLFKPRRIVVDAELARFRLHLWSENEEMEATINREIHHFERGDVKIDMPFETGESRLQQEVERVVRIYLPPQIEIREFNVEYSQSVIVTFSLIWAGTISLYVLISHYDSFRRSLDRIKDDLTRLLARIASRSHLAGRLAGDMQWEPSRVLIELEDLRSRQDQVASWLNLNPLFVLYLIVSNFVLALIVALLVFHAVRTVYFP